MTTKIIIEASIAIIVCIIFLYFYFTSESEHGGNSISHFFTTIFLFLITIILIAGCTKEIPAPTPTNQFTATVFLTPTEQTVGYDKNAPQNLWVWALRINKVKSNPFSFRFDFPGLVCNGITYADPHKKLYGATRELIAHGNPLEVNYNSIIIK